MTEQLAEVVDKPRKELEELEEEQKFIHDLLANGAAKESDLEELRIIDEKLARRKPEGS